MAAGVLVRRADAIDTSAIARIHVAGWHSAYSDFLPPETLDRMAIADQERYWQAALKSGSDCVVTLVAEQAGALVGFCTTVLPSAPGHAAEISAIYVDPSMWRQGVGKVLLAAGLDQARAAGVDTAFLWVFERNESAQHFYEGFGFAADGATLRHASGQMALRMSMALEGPQP